MNDVQVLLTEEEKSRLTRLANYIAAGISNRQAGAAVGLSEARVSQLQREDDLSPSALFFRSRFDDAAAASVEEVFDLQKQQQKIIAKALGNVESALSGYDPEFSLKALAVVSKMPRSNGMNRPEGAALQAANGARITLQLNMAFVNRAQNGEVRSRTFEEAAIEKEINFLAPAAVEAFLSSNAPLHDSIEQAKRMFEQAALIPTPGDS